MKKNAGFNTAHGLSDLIGDAVDQLIEIKDRINSLRRSLQAQHVLYRVRCDRSQRRRKRRRNGTDASRGSHRTTVYGPFMFSCRMLAPVTWIRHIIAPARGPSRDYLVPDRRLRSPASLSLIRFSIPSLVGW